MFWLTDEEVLSNGLVDKEPFSLTDGEIAETFVDKDGAEVWDCETLGLIDAGSSEDDDTVWLRLAVALWDVGSDLLEDDGSLTDSLIEGETLWLKSEEDLDEKIPSLDTFALADAVVDKGRTGLWVCETFIDEEMLWLKNEEELVETRKSTPSLATCELTDAVVDKNRAGLCVCETLTDSLSDWLDTLRLSDASCDMLWLVFAVALSDAGKDEKTDCVRFLV